MQLNKLLEQSSTFKKYHHKLQQFQRKAAGNKLNTNWVIPINQPVISILQPPRSGGTLLLRLFDGHPQLHVWPKPAGGMDFINATINLNFHILRKQFNLAVHNSIGLVKGASNNPQKIIPIYFDEKWHHTLLKSYLKETPTTPRQLFDILKTSGFNAWRNYQGLYGPQKKWVVIHTVPDPKQELDHFAKNFSTIYPDGHIICTLRNPLDWLASAIHLQHSNRWSNDIDAALSAYIKYYSGLPINHPNITLLNFEDLLSDSEATLKKICKKIQCDFMESFLQTTTNNIPVFANSSHSFKKINKPDPSLIGKGGKILNLVENLPDYQKAVTLYQAAQRRLLTNS